MRRKRSVPVRALAALVFAAGLSGCAGPAAPDWQAAARGAIDRSLAAYLKGDGRVAAAELQRARAEIGRTGRADLLARVELMACAARVASLVFDPCEGFERLRADAPAAERAYADYLAGRGSPADAGLLPAQHRALASAGVAAESAAAALRGVDDALARLVAAGVLLQAGRAHPGVLAVAVDTASEQGWRRPLLAWLNAQIEMAEKAGDAQQAERLRRRLRVAEQGVQ
jgi:hypothetical protein